MRLATVLGLLALLTPLAAAWSKEDREIFRLRDEIATHEGANVTFYDFLGITRSASQDEVSKAYKKKSRSLHPDKVKQQLTAERAQAAKEKSGKTSSARKSPSQHEIKVAIKAASERQTRLSIIANVLKGPGRERYDHFLANGFPTWKGTEYYYARYRPGFGTVIVGFFLFAGGAAHYLALYMGWKRQREFVQRYITFARNAAWGDNMNIPGLEGTSGTQTPPQGAPGDTMTTNRKQRRMQEKDARREAATEAKGRARKVRSNANLDAATPVRGSGGPTGAKKRVVAENGKVLVVDSLGDVYLEQHDEEGNVQEFLLDPDSLARPTFMDTAVVRLPVFAWNLTLGRMLGSGASNAVETTQPVTREAEVELEDSDEAKDTPSTGSADDGFELLDKSVDDLGIAKTTGTQASGQSKNGKRKTKKR